MASDTEESTPIPTAPDASALFLSELTGSQVLVKLHSGIEYRGVLQSIDGFMNLALEGTNEFVDNQKTNSFGDVFIRGNNDSAIKDQNNENNNLEELDDSEKINISSTDESNRPRDALDEALEREKIEQNQEIKEKEGGEDVPKEEKTSEIQEISEKEVKNEEDSSSDSDSDTDNPSSDDSSDNDLSDDEKVQSDNEEGSSIPIKSFHEIDEGPAPSVPADFSLTEDTPIELIGELKNIVELTAVVKSRKSGETKVLDEKSVLCFGDRQILGVVFETFGRVDEPMYSVKFNNEQEADKFKLRTNQNVYYVVPSSKFVSTESVRAVKGSDASNVYDEEIADNEKEYSDDEAERNAKASKKRKKKDEKKSGKEGKFQRNNRNMGQSGYQMNQSRHPMTQPGYQMAQQIPQGNYQMPQQGQFAANQQGYPIGQFPGYPMGQTGPYPMTQAGSFPYYPQMMAPASNTPNQYYHRPSNTYQQIPNMNWLPNNYSYQQFNYNYQGYGGGIGQRGYGVGQEGSRQEGFNGSRQEAYDRSPQTYDGSTRPDNSKQQRSNTRDDKDGLHYD